MKSGLVLLMLLMVTDMSGQSWGQPGKGHGRGLGPAMQGRIYDPQTEVTVKGKVTEVGTYPSMGPGAARGMNYRGVSLKTDQGDMIVHLGPAWYMDEQKLAVGKGDTLEVTGAKTTQDGKPVMLAREFTQNGKKTVLRNNQGIPVWRGQGPGRGGPGGGMGQGRGRGGPGGSGAK